ncbi:cytochrome c biogenesis protein CcdA [Halopiger xanaduensis]|uniref:Cytochrome c biogenesis protein transmembrane region n=1 Tax=Halopiger xanaduensis (strain DSM 18323 / JCM 14033 / SH-6) TaxID=797210 RepID=F8D5X7_HALXS|nr:cytochrome c biogenesis protein CcdA [Halopiger xanaduensis]AEH37703.1 cytochrome c biogenesis protein transmembrane region [Halopiger xanaduensis SH-6]
MVDAPALESLTFALIAGISTFFSPCAYPLLPGYVGFYVNQTEGERASLGGALGRGVVAGLGTLGTFAVLFGSAFWIGHATLSNIVYFEPLIGALLVGFGLLVVFDRAPSLSVPLPQRRSSVLGFGVFGAGYALAAAGCVAPLFVGVVAQALSLPAASAAAVIGTYVGSIVVLMVSLTVATGMGLLAGAGRFVTHGKRLKRLAGAIMIVAGLGQLYLAVVILDVL